MEYLTSPVRTNLIEVTSVECFHRPSPQGKSATASLGKVLGIPEGSVFFGAVALSASLSIMSALIASAAAQMLRFPAEALGPSCDTISTSRPKHLRRSLVLLSVGGARPKSSQPR